MIGLTMLNLKCLTTLYESAPYYLEESKKKSRLYSVVMPWYFGVYLPFVLEAIYNKDEQKGSSGKSDYSNAGALPLPAAAIDHEIEILLAEWNKNADMMFSIHPMDGSLLVWHVDWLDEYQPGMFRQVQVL